MSRLIRIYKIIPVADGLEAWGDVHRALLASIASPDVEICQVDLPHAPIRAISSQFHTDLVAPLQSQEAIKAARAGFDAVVMGCLDEPGVAGAKEAVDIPVVGEAEAAMHYASMVGRRFSFVGGGDQAGLVRGGLLVDLANKYGFASKLASVRRIASHSLDFASQKDGLREAMLAQAKLAVDADGADAIIGYGGIDIIRYVQERLMVPVISPIQASVLMAESLVRLKLAQSKKAYPTPAGL